MSRHSGDGGQAFTDGRIGFCHVGVTSQASVIISRVESSVKNDLYLPAVMSRYSCDGGQAFTDVRIGFGHIVVTSNVSGMISRLETLVKITHICQQRHQGILGMENKLLLTSE